MVVSKYTRDHGTIQPVTAPHWWYTEHKFHSHLLYSHAEVIFCLSVTTVYNPSDYCPCSTCISFPAIKNSKWTYHMPVLAESLTLSIELLMLYQRV